MKKLIRLVSLIMATVIILSMQLPLASAAPKVSGKSKPTLSLSSKSATSITLKWKEFGDADGYKVYRKTSKNGKWKMIKDTSAISYTNKGLKLNKTYWYKVRAYAEGDKKNVYSPYSKVKSGSPQLAEPKLKVKNTSANSVKLTISKPSGATGVVIYRKTSASGKWKKLKQTSKSTYTDKGLKNEKKYYYRAKAYKKIGKKNYYSDYTSQLKKKTGLDTVEISVFSAKSKSATITWYEVYGATKYQVYMKIAGEKYKKVKTTSSLSATIKFNTTKKVYFKVRALQVVGKKTYYGEFCEEMVNIKYLSTAPSTSAPSASAKPSTTTKPTTTNPSTDSGTSTKPPTNTTEQDSTITNSHNKPDTPNLPILPDISESPDNTTAPNNPDTPEDSDIG